MTSSGQVKRKAVLKMLKNCAPDFKIQEGIHNDTVVWRGKEFAGLGPSKRRAWKRPPERSG